MADNFYFTKYKDSLLFTFYFLILKHFSKIAFFFNLAFLFAAIMRFIERRDAAGASPLSSWQPVENTLIVMGYCAILVNFIFLVFLSARKILGKHTSVPQWILIFNSVLLILQVLYFFVLP